MLLRRDSPGGGPLREQPAAQALPTAWERLSPDDQKRWLTEATKRLHPILQDLSTPRREDLERYWRESPQRYRNLPAWLERQPVPLLSTRRPGRRRVT